MKNEKSYSDNIKELKDAEKELKRAFEKAWHDFLNALGKKMKIDVLCDYIVKKLRNNSPFKTNIY